MKVVLVADNDLTRTMGLMHHHPLGKDECAYFYFNRTGKHSFWNKNVSFPISLIFANKEGEVRDIKYLQAHQTDGVYPDAYDIDQVIEAHVEAPEHYGIKKGSKIIVRNNEVHFE